MHRATLSLIALAALSGCDDSDFRVTLPEGATLCQRGDGGTDGSPDQGTPPKASCKAAQGVAGDAITCVDFDKVTTLTDPKLAGWDFTSFCPAGWEISNGKLQVKNFGSFTSTCILTLPSLDLNSAANQKYQRVTLALLHRVHLSEAEQKAQIMLGADDAVKRLLHQSTGVQPRQRTLIEVNRTDLPVATGGAFQPLFKISSSASFGMGFQGWQFESIAVVASP